MKITDEEINAESKRFAYSVAYYNNLSEGGKLKAIEWGEKFHKRGALWAREQLSGTISLKEFKIGSAMYSIGEQLKPPAMNEIKLLRKELKLKQGELAERVGISQTYLSQIETGHRIPTIVILRAIANQLNRILVITFEPIK